MSRQDAEHAEHFVRQCREELKHYPRSPITPTRETAKEIDMSGIFRMTPEEIDAALSREVA